MNNSFVNEFSFDNLSDIVRKLNDRDNLTSTSAMRANLRAFLAELMINNVGTELASTAVFLSRTKDLVFFLAEDYIIFLKSIPASWDFSVLEWIELIFAINHAPTCLLDCDENGSKHVTSSNKPDYFCIAPFVANRFDSKADFIHFLRDYNDMDYVSLFVDVKNCAHVDKKERALKVIEKNFSVDIPISLFFTIAFTPQPNLLGQKMENGKRETLAKIRRVLTPIACTC